MKYKRIFTIVIDSVGVGALPDAKEYGDAGTNTIRSVAKEKPLNIPNLEKLGMGNITDINGVEKVSQPIGYYTKAGELSVGKDTLTGHWEIMGVEVKEPFKVFTDTGFPSDLIEEIEKLSGRKVIGNKSASGTVILDELGEEHMETGALIVYTSADSVLQIAAHEEIVPINELWDICKKVRKLTMDERWKVARIIARPFLGPGKGKFTRTANRHDYAIDPFGKTVLDDLKDNGYDVIGIGKINDIYNGQGITDHEYTTSNEDGMDKLIESIKRDFTGLSFLNLVDFDAKYGHRRDPIGYANAIEAFDHRLTEVLGLLKEDDLLIITADHGNDPLHKGTDHTREYVPVIFFNKDFERPGNLEDLSSFACIGATIKENFELGKTNIGYSVLDKLV